MVTQTNPEKEILMLFPSWLRKPRSIRASGQPEPFRSGTSLLAAGTRFRPQSSGVLRIDNSVEFAGGKGFVVSPINSPHSKFSAVFVFVATTNCPVAS